MFKVRVKGQRSNYETLEKSLFQTYGSRILG